MITHLKKLWYWLWVDFDLDHALLAPITLIPVVIYPATWTTILSSTLALLFLGYECLQAARKGDKGYNEVKGFLIGLYPSVILLVGLYRIFRW